MANDCDAIDLMREVATLLERLEWRPIATAPLDGRRILVWTAKSGCALAYWFATDDDYGWWSSDEQGVVQPTHWMPLPPAPING